MKNGERWRQERYDVQFRRLLGRRANSVPASNAAERCVKADLDYCIVVLMLLFPQKVSITGFRATCTL